MHVQKSFDERDVGTLYLVSTPIGNLEDMTYRAVNVLKQVDEIAAEDTRHTKKLLTHFEIATPLTSYHEHNKASAGKKLIDKLLAGRSIALVSDAGMPAISDPGSELVAEAIRARIPVVPVPGANAALTALIASGLSTTVFHFYGFLPRTPKKMREQLEQLSHHEGTLIFYEAPHRLSKTLDMMQKTWGNRRAVLARELTKRHEEFMRGTLDELLQWVKEHPPRGEYCVLVEGLAMTNAGQDLWWKELSVQEHVERYRKRGDDLKQAIKKAAQDRGVPKREIYAVIHRDSDTT